MLGFSAVCQTPLCAPPVSGNIAAETNVSFVARYKSSRINVLSLLRQYNDFEPAVSETNVHFVSKFHPSIITVRSAYRFNPDIEPPVAETNTYVLGRFNPVRVNVLQGLRQNPDVEPPAIETNTYVIGRFAPASLRFFRFNHEGCDFSSAQYIVDTTRLQMPINCILADQQDYEMGPSEIDARPPNVHVKVTISSGPVKRYGEPSTFTIRTDKKGYD